MGSVKDVVAFESMVLRSRIDTSRRHELIYGLWTVNQNSSCLLEGTLAERKVSETESARNLKHKKQPI